MTTSEVVSHRRHLPLMIIGLAFGTALVLLWHEMHEQRLTISLAGGGELLDFRGFGVAGGGLLLAPLLLAPPVLCAARGVSYLVPAFHRTKRRALIIGTALGFLLPLPLFIAFQIILGIC